VLGHGWDERLLAEGRAPTRTELDRASAGGVVQLTRVDGHSSVVSTALAEAAGARTLPGWTDDGRVERNAHHAVRAAAREELTPAAREHAQRVALRAAAAAGIGCVHEMSAPHIAPESDLAVLAALTGPDGDEPLPDVVWYRGQLVTSEAEAKEVVARLQDAGVPQVAGLAGDLNADGAVGSRTAAFRTPYADAPGHTGHLYLSAEQIRDHVAACTSTGLQAGFHVIGDAGLDVVLEGFRRAAERIGIAAVRAGEHRLEHVETPDEEAVARLADLGLTASVQPAFDAAWGGPDGMYTARLGAERAVRMNPFAALAAAGVPLAFGSDSPVTPFAPWEAVRAAVFHTNSEQRITAEAAFAAQTRGAWRAARRPGEGVLALGAPATLAVWAVGTRVVQAPDDRIQARTTDPPSGTPELPDLEPGVEAPRCLRTVVRGRVVHDTLT
jgi:predicted amidohydrolase YtcJ